MSEQTIARYADYDAFAWMYNLHWGDFSQRIVPHLEQLMLRRLPPAARLLDLCCGTGQLAQALSALHYRVTGLDGSDEMLRYARANAPSVEFILSDARAFALPEPVHGVVCVFDSLNHIMSMDELLAVFRNVHAALVSGGLFLFDLNMDEGFRARWQGHVSIVEDDHVGVFRSSYQLTEGIATFEATLFRLQDGDWQRSDLTLTQKRYSKIEIRDALGKAGFTEIHAYDADRDLKMDGATGRAFFVCRKPVRVESNERRGG